MASAYELPLWGIGFNWSWFPNGSARGRPGESESRRVASYWVSCDHCHCEITPGTERTVWDGVKRWVRVCALCFPFAVSVMFGQTSPQEAPPPIMIDVGAGWSATGNTSPGTFTNTSATNLASGTVNIERVWISVDSPPWASPEQRGEHHRLSYADLKLSSADQARLRSR
jgi:hypothetical protein